MAEDLFFDGDFGGVGEFEAVGAEELDAVVLPGIVGGGDDYSGGEFVGVGEEGYGGGGDDSGGLYGGASGDEAGGEGGGDPGAGFAGVHAEEDFGGCSEMMGEGDADGVDGGGVERGLAGDGSDAVGAEELLHMDQGTRYLGAGYQAMECQGRDVHAIEPSIAGRQHLVRSLRTQSSCGDFGFEGAWGEAGGDGLAGGGFGGVAEDLAFGVVDDGVAAV